MTFNPSYNKRVLSLNVRVLALLNKMESPSVRINIFLEVVRTLLLESFVHPRFWVEALSTNVYLINRQPSQTLILDSPYFHLFGVPPDY